MKNLIFTVLLSSLLIFTNAQEKSITKAIPLPSVDIKTVNGKSFNTKDIQNDGKPIIICFLPHGVNPAW